MSMDPASRLRLREAARLLREGAALLDEFRREAPKAEPETPMQERAIPLRVGIIADRMSEPIFELENLVGTLEEPRSKGDLLS